MDTDSLISKSLKLFWCYNMRATEINVPYIFRRASLKRVCDVFENCSALKVSGKLSQQLKESLMCVCVIF